MNVPFRQDTRRGQLATVLGPEALLLLRLRGEDRLNGMSVYRVEALSASSDIDLNAVLGTQGSVAITAEGGVSHFAGIVTEAAFAGVAEGGFRYDLTLRPWLWLAGLRRNQRIFHTKTVVEIVTEVFADYASLGAPAVDWQLTQDYPKLEYTVQYGESDADFATRLLERFGISRIHRSHAGGQTLVLTDAAERLARVPGGGRPFRTVQTAQVTDHEHFRSWTGGARVTTGAVRLTEWNFKTPLAAQEVDRTGDAGHAQGRIEAFDWPGDYLNQSQGKDVVALRTREERGAAGRIGAKGDVCSLHAGMMVRLTGDKIPGATGKDFVCLTATHDYTAEGYVTGGVAATEDSYAGQYRLMPKSSPLVPPRRTAVPIIHGPQTAVVVGEGEIDCDEFGRILVRFPWDLKAAHSMRCRVSQNWASQGWGGMVIPRIGMEVLVEFLEGDPDKPLVTGCVYNGRNTVPYALPDSKTRSTFRTNSHDGKGTAIGFNELRFEDQAEQEEIFLHAQKDHNTVILNDESHSIGHDRSKSVGNDQSESVGQDKRITVGRDHTESIGRDARHTIGNDVILEVGRNQQERYGKDHVEHVGNILKQVVHADHLEEIGRNYTGEVAGTYTLDVGRSITTNTGKHMLMAFEKFTIAGPGGKITIDATGITLEAAVIRLKGAVMMGGSGSAQVPTLRLAANEGLPLCEECARDGAS
jgi:type VI secretion system secreted protein VgrG